MLHLRLDGLNKINKIIIIKPQMFLYYFIQKEGQCQGK